MPSRVQSPEEQARLHYDDGLRMRDKAWKYEQKAAKQSKPKKQAKLERKAARQYEKAIDAFSTASRLNPEFHEAFGSLGYALRKTGRYDQALVAYDRALSIDPRYVEAIEYRGEAYLGLARIEEAQQAYMSLFTLDGPRADELMAAMQAWLAGRHEDSGALSAEQVEQFSNWIRLRLEIAGQTDSLSKLQDRDW